MDLTILLLTYNRTEYALRTLCSALENIKYTRGNLRVHIADDGSEMLHQAKLFNAAREKLDFNLLGMTDSMRGGYGKNYNLATQAIHYHSKYVLCLEDDWELTRPLDLDPLTSALDCGEFGCVRLGYLGWTQPLKGELVYCGGMHFLRFDHDSPERHVFAGHPRLETVAWQRDVGPWLEGLQPGETEFQVSGLEAARVGVAWPLDVVKPCGDLFAHIGTIRSY